MTAVGYALLGQGRSVVAADLLRKAVALGTRELGADHLSTVSAAVVNGEALTRSGVARGGPPARRSRRARA